jgi:hypothetical protein
MSLRKKQTMTGRKISANKANGKHSKGPATPEGRKQIREANTRHGFYSQPEAVALVCLGEDPADLERLRKNLHDGLQIPGALREELAEHLAQVVWRWKRAGRQQEGFALRLAKQANLTREDRLHAQMMRLKLTEESLRLLASSVVRRHYVTTPEDLEMMKNLHQEGAVKETGDMALALFYQLQKPGTGKDGIDPEEKRRHVMNKIRAIFGLSPLEKERAEVPTPEEQTPQAEGDGEEDGTPDESPANVDSEAGATEEEERDERYPEITAAEWELRKRPCQLLANILTRQVEIFEAQRHALLKESLAGPSPYERAAEIALAHPDVAMMQRMEESSFRQIWRITNLLLKINRQASGVGISKYHLRSQNVHENTPR